MGWLLDTPYPVASQTPVSPACLVSWVAWLRRDSKSIQLATITSGSHRVQVVGLSTSQSGCDGRPNTVKNVISNRPEQSNHGLPCWNDRIWRVKNCGLIDTGILKHWSAEFQEVIAISSLLVRCICELGLLVSVT